MRACVTFRLIVGSQKEFSMTQMSNRRVVPVVVILLIGVLCAQDRVQSELRFAAHSKDEKTAGVWVDGQYVGFVKELAGDKKLMLLPGKHEIVIRQAWYNEFVNEVILQPGKTYEVKVELVKSAQLPTKDATGELKIAATPSRAAVFVDGQYAGHVDEFDGVGQAMLLTPGQHRLHIALPGYLPFDTMVDLRPHQKLKIQTDLVKGSITEAGSQVNKQ
jgi:PEGA domain